MINYLKLLAWIITWSARSSINTQNQSCEDATTCNCTHTLVLLAPDTGPKYPSPFWLHCLWWNLQPCGDRRPAILSREQCFPKGNTSYKQPPWPSMSLLMRRSSLDPGPPHRLCELWPLAWPYQDSAQGLTVWLLPTQFKQETEKKKLSFHMKRRLSIYVFLNTSRTLT